MTKLAVAILLALTMPASAQDHGADYYLPGCKGILARESTTKPWQMLCLGFIEGLVYGARGRDFCPPDYAIGQAVGVVVKYIEARPERMMLPFGELAKEAMIAAWPCKR
jgi:Rap1a immunity proteins